MKQSPISMQSIMYTIHTTTLSPLQYRSCCHIDTLTLKMVILFDLIAILELGINKHLTDWLTDQTTDQPTD